MLLLFIPLWVSEALRAFAWYIILTFNGPLNALLKGLGVHRRAGALAERGLSPLRCHRDRC